MSWAGRPAAKSRANNAHGAGDTSELRAFDGGHFDLIAVGSSAWSMSVRAVSDLAGR
jgi:hypothetical protein